MSTILRGGTVVSSDVRVEADVLLDGGKVAAIGLDLSSGSGGIEIVDVTGRLLLPGGVDVHTHLDAPFMGTVTSDDFETGTVAAACGGTTTIVDFAMQAKGEKLPDTLETWSKKASEAVVDYSFHLAITDPYEGCAADMASVAASGVTSYKVFMAYKGQIMISDGELFKLLRRASQLGSTVCVHAENGEVIDVLATELVEAGHRAPRYHAVSRPPETEVEAVRRAISIAKMADSPIYFVHLSTEGSVEAVHDAQAREEPVSGETCTHYLFLGPELYDLPGFDGAKVVLTPPLREREHREGLWRGLTSGTLGIVSSDHCPFCMSGQKELGKEDFRLIPNGGPGVEHRLPLLYGEGVRKGRLTLERFVDVVASGPAKRFGLYPRKGTISIGTDADIVVLDPEGETRITAESQHQRVDYTPYEGWVVPGRVDRVYSRGEAIVQQGQFVGRIGRGRFLERRPA